MTQVHRLLTEPSLNAKHKWGAGHKRRKTDKGSRMRCISQFQSADISQDTQHFGTSKMQLMEANCAIFSHLHPTYFEWIIRTAWYSDM